MAKSKERLSARNLRKRGFSVKLIAKQLRVSKSTVSLWVRDIVLTIQQQEKLKKQSIVGAERGRLLGSLKQKEGRLKRIEEGKLFGIQRVNNVSERDFFLSGIALYWAEGNKKMKKIEFCNSDPNLVRFLIAWFQRFFELKREDFKCYVGVNLIHKKREEQIKKYWSTVTGFSLDQFTKTSFKKSKPHKIYENFHDHYGTLSVKVLKSARILYRMAGLIEALRAASLPA
jgi:hypothetical protein